MIFKILPQTRLSLYKDIVSNFLLGDVKGVKNIYILER